MPQRARGDANAKQRPRDEKFESTRVDIAKLTLPSTNLALASICGVDDRGPNCPAAYCKPRRVRREASNFFEHFSVQNSSTRWRVTSERFVVVVRQFHPLNEKRKLTIIVSNVDGASPRPTPRSVAVGCGRGRTSHNSSNQSSGISIEERIPW